jgi:hypothetical protein
MHSLVHQNIFIIITTSVALFLSEEDTHCFHYCFSRQHLILIVMYFHT